MSAGRMESNSLPIVADRIRELVAESEAAALSSADKAMQAGRLLAEAKAQCKHGEWLPFLASTDIKERRARQYMQIATSGLKSATIADLGGIRAALEFLALRAKAEEALVEALEAMAAGRRGLEGLRKALEVSDALADMFPERMREGIRRSNADNDAERIALRVADILDQAPLPAH